MDITTEKLHDDLNVVVKIKMEPEDYMPDAEKSVKDYSKKVNLKGFRQGKVPAGVVKKMFGKEILAETLNKKVNENLSSYLEQQDLKILGDPLPAEESTNSLDIHNPSGVEFKYELGLQPEFEIPMLKDKFEITGYKIITDDQLVNEEVENLRKRYGKMTNPDDIREGDVLYVELKELDENGNTKEGGISNMPSFPVELLKEKKREEAMKMKKEDTLEVDLFEDLDMEKGEIADRMLNVDPSKLEEINSRFSMTLKNINRRVPADIDKELFDKLYGEGNITSEEEFRNKLKEELESLLKVNAERKLNKDVADKLLKETEVHLPADFLRKWLLATNENLSDDDLEKEFPLFIDNLKWSLIVNKILRDYELEVQKEELEEKTRQMIQMEYGFSYEDESVKPYIDDFTAKMMANKEHVNKLYENVRDEKALNKIKENIEIKEKEVTFEEFKELK